MAAIMAVAAVLPALAQASPSVRLRFARVATLGRLSCRDSAGETGLLFTDRVRVLTELRTGRSCRDLLVLNPQTGRERILHIRGAGDPVAFGGGFVLFDQPYRLLDIATARWRTLRCPGGCEPPDEIGASYDVGRRWVQLTFMQGGDCGDGVHEGCGPTVTTFYDIVHGRVVQPPAKDAAHIYDLDVPGLVRPLCPPLHDVTSSGYLSPLGRFAIVFAGGGDAYSGPPEPTTLEACGSRLQMPIAGGEQADPDALFLATTRVIVWNQGGPESAAVAGLILPSRRRFSAMLPSWFADGEPGYDGLIGRRLYGIDRHGHLEVATLPAR